MAWYGDYVRSASITVKDAGDPFLMEDEDNDDDYMVMKMASDIARNRRPSDAGRRQHRRPTEDKATQTTPWEITSLSTCCKNYLPLAACMSLVTTAVIQLVLHFNSNKNTRTSTCVVGAILISVILQTSLLLSITLYYSSNWFKIKFKRLENAFDVNICLICMCVCLCVYMLNCFIYISLIW